VHFSTLGVESLAANTRVSRIRGTDGPDLDEKAGVPRFTRETITALTENNFADLTGILDGWCE